MTISEIKDIAKLAHKPLGDAHLDGLFALDCAAIYYRFIYHLMRVIKPSFAVELGVCTGRCTAHMAAAAPECRVIAIDPIVHNAFDVWRKYTNIDLRPDLSTSKKVLDSVPDKSIDLLFVDTEHTYYQVMAEYKAWLRKMKVGGVMLFDDITLGPSMMEAWTELVKVHGSENCVSLPELHHSGFGAIEVRP